MTRQIDYKTMRIVVGLIALLLAPTVCWLADVDKPLTSISISYWTNSHDLFVGALIAVGFFLSAYNGTGYRRDWEFYLSKVSFVCATCVALFPTEGFDPCTNIPPSWTVRVADAVGLKPQFIHYGSAILLFSCLIALMWFFAGRAEKKGKRGRARTYRAISLLMVGGIVVLFALGKRYDLEKVTLYIETWALTLFGIGWLLAGCYRTNETQPADQPPRECPGPRQIVDPSL